MTAQQAHILPVIFTTLIVLAVHCAAAGGDRHGAHPRQGDWRLTWLPSKLILRSAHQPSGSQ